MSPSYSVRYRLQRITREAASVSVPIAPDLLTDDRRINTEKVAQLAVKLGTDPSTPWEADGESAISLRPFQLPPK